MVILVKTNKLALNLQECLQPPPLVPLSLLLGNESSYIKNYLLGRSLASSEVNSFKMSGVSETFRLFASDCGGSLYVLT